MFFTIYIASVMAAILFTICYLIKFSEIAKEYKIKNISTFSDYIIIFISCLIPIYNLWQGYLYFKNIMVTDKDFLENVFKSNLDEE